MAERESESIGIVDVLDNLSVIAEADSLDELEVNENFQFIPHQPDEEVREFYWVRAGANDLTLMAIRENFRSALKYLNALYKKAEKEEEKGSLIERINQIMVLVGEASAKLARMDLLFKDKLPKLAEFKELQSFYKNVVVKSESEIPSEMLLGIMPAEEVVEEVGGVHILNNIDVILQDKAYELFYMKNEAEADFYTDALARNLKVSCDFGKYAKEYSGDDPLVQIKNWQDKAVQVMAKEVIGAVHKQLESLFREMGPNKELELVSLLKRSLLALMLSSNPRNLLRQYSPKGCYLYFSDFQQFLRELLTNREYTHYSLYASPLEQPFSKQLSSIIGAMIFQIYTTGPDRKEMVDVISELTKDGGKSDSLSEFLMASAKALNKVLENHPNGPLFKTLDLLREEKIPAYDPWLLGNFPEKVSELLIDEKKCTLLRLPPPITQENISRATVTEEFRTFLSTLSQKGLKLLYIDFQDRTSWNEHSRVKAIEALSKEALFSDVFTYVNMTKETDFYRQESLYHNLSDSSEFVRQLYLNLSDESCGFYFSPKLKKELFPIFTEKLLGRVWESFFDKKSELSREERLKFIEITYLLLTLKIIEIEEPNFVTLTSKDGLDIGSASLIELIAMIGCGTKHKWKKGDFDLLSCHLLSPTLLFRERSLHEEPLNRMVETIALLEAHQGFFQEFSSLYHKPTLKTEIVFL